ncbi:SDR family NAD(P)-dependent oxidoreductase [Nostocoides sp. F2B08]|uniref:oxidoreductase n=1 Tax=Nostocoides sp. F2B08 TaxID=2653936 RepID=UPI0012639249|nr:oxidoreductase [Tetrasphaera sp. F2B08]KAB7743930.1 SDR family NAD(P)-dependent oxidoreductase [Tetrasphaera sp. F2B08]
MQGNRWTAGDLPDLTGRTAVVTGATSGIGRETALALAGHGARVLLAVRNTQAGAELARELPGSSDVVRLDLASLDSVRDCAQSITEPIDLLVNNAGVMTPPRRRLTDDGFELQFQTNHLGHFALTGLLLPRLLETPAPRVTTVSSIAHRGGTRELVDGNLTGAYNPQTAYGNSKLANLLFALELQRRAVAAGSTLTSTAAHPGVTATNLVASPDGLGSIPLLGVLSRPLTRLFLPSAAHGAESTLYAATVAGPGSYTGPTGMRETRGPIGPAALSPLARDADLAADLWRVSEERTGVRYEQLA